METGAAEEAGEIEMSAENVQVTAGLVAVIAIIAVAISFWKICERTGLSKWLVLLMFIPLVNFALPCIIAFSNWPKVATGPQRGVVYTPSELEEFKRHGQA